MSGTQQGGCLCGKIRFEVEATQDRNAYRCYCSFCQKLSGNYLFGVCFDRSEFSLLADEPAHYSYVSRGSGKKIYVHFCRDCGTTLHLTFERFTDTTIVPNGTFDDPNWFDASPQSTRYLFMRNAPDDAIVPAGFSYFSEHCITLDGRDVAPAIGDGTAPALGGLRS